MAIRTELRILTTAEQQDFYSPPIFSEDEQRFFFAPNEAEWLSIRRSKD